jgi:acid phosphatase (class A)
MCAVQIQRTVHIPAILVLSVAAAAAQGPQAPAPAAPTSAQPQVAAPAPGGATPPRRVGYLAPGTAPDILRVLAPPPLEGDSRDAADLAVFRTTRSLQGTPRWAMAQRDNALGTPAVLQAFSCALDAVITPAEAPSLVRLLAQAGFDAGVASTSGKNSWRRKRPYERTDGPVCLPADEIERLARLSPDYPSGHATAAWMAGRLLAQVAPDRTTEILERARTFGESRVVCGVHHVTAVEAGRLTAEGVLAALHGVPAFRADLESAREEVSRLRGKVKPPAAACAADAAVLAERAF